jgi:hypothetical protein
MFTKRSETVAMVLALAGLIITPVLLFIEVSGLFLVGMILAEPSNSVATKALAVGAMVILALLALVLPLMAFTSNSRILSRVLAGVSLAGWVLAQLFIIGIFLGLCSFEGCFPA